MEILILKELSEFKNLESSWNELALKNNNIFLTFDWQFEWWRHFGSKKGTLFILVVREGREIIGIAPLMLIKRLGFNEIRFIGTGISDYEDLIICDDSRKDEITTDILTKIGKNKNWDILKLSKLRLDPQGLSSLKDAKKKQSNPSVLVKQHQDGAPYIVIKKKWDEYCTGLRKKIIADTRRQINRIKDLDQNFVIANIDKEEDVGAYLEKLAFFHRAKRAQQGSQSIFGDKTSYDFLLVVAKKFFRKGWLSLSYIRIGGAIAALHLGFSFNGVFYYYLPGYNPDFEKYSIGRILLFDLLQQSFSGAVRKFDFMLGEEMYKKEWGTEVEPLYFLTITPRSIKGFLARQLHFRANLMAKKILNKKW